MSHEESLVCSSPDPLPSSTVPTSSPNSVSGSSRASSSSSQRRTSLTNGLIDKLADGPPPHTSSLRTSLPRSSSDVLPHVVDGGAESSGTSTPDVDPQIIEALKSKDRLFLLKLGEQMEMLIREYHSRSRATVSPENQYQRLLVHRCAQYYKLLPENDPTPRDKSGVRDMIVSITPESRIPPRRIFELVPAEQTSHPTFKIMRRSEQDRRQQKSTNSRPGSTAGEDGELSDPGPSEHGSMGSRSTASKKRMTIAEREAAYEEARTRIFSTFEEREKAKERDTSASSSTLSLASASGSGSQSGGAGCSSVSDIDDSASTAPTESEWSVPVADRRRGRDSGFNSADSTRSFPAYVPGVVSERALGTSSPALTFPSLYDPSGATQAYEQQQQHTYIPPPPGSYGGASYPMYYPAQAPPNAPLVPVGQQPYVQPYHYYPHYTYPAFPPPPAPSHGSPIVGPADAHPHQPHNHGGAPYMGPQPYGWMHPPSNYQQPQQNQSDNNVSPAAGRNQIQSPPLQGPSPAPYPYPPYTHPPGAFPYPPYFQAPPQAQPPVVHPNSQPVYHVELPPVNVNGSGSDRDTPSGHSSGKGSPSPTLSRHTSSSGSNVGYYNHVNGSVGNKRSTLISRGGWIYGPAAGGAQTSMSGCATHGSPGGGGETVGPRLNTIRRTSGASSSSSGYRTPGEETASVASSSTSSSSSRRTFNVTTPPKHPLPPRPDWAAGLKAQPTLHPPNRHRHDSINSRTMSPIRPPVQLPNNNQIPLPQQRPPIHLQSTDFPPLSSSSNAQCEKRPLAGSVWTNAGPGVRAVLFPNPGHSDQAPANAVGTALFNHRGANAADDDERGFERPPPKNKAELFNPKAGSKRNCQPLQSSERPTSQASDPEVGRKSSEQKADKDQARDEAVASAILIDKMGSLKIQDQHLGSEIENTPKAESLLCKLEQLHKPAIVDGGDGTGVGTSGDRTTPD